MTPLIPLALALSVAQAPAAPPASPPAAATYSGHGLSSLDPKVLDRFAPRPVDPELTRRVQRMKDVRAPGLGILSDDGRRLFFTWSVTGTAQVWRLDGPDRFPVQLTGGDERTSVVTVTPDGRTLVVSRDRKGEENPGIYLLPAEGGAPREVQHLPGVQSRAAFLSADGRWLYYSANDRQPDAYAVYRYELATGRKELLVDAPGLWSPADLRDDGTLLLQKETGSLTSEWWERPAAGGALRPVLGQDEREEYAVLYGAAPGELLVQTPKGSEFRRLYRLRAGKLEPISPPLRWDVAEFTIDRARRHVFYSVNEGGYARLFALDARTLRPERLPAFPGADHVVAGEPTRSGRLLPLGIETPRAPRASYVLDTATGKLTRWVVPSSPEVDTRRFAVATLEQYPARDGTLIPAFVRRPEACAAAALPCPVVIEFHGGPEAQSRPGFDPTAQLFVDEGFIFVEPNVRGSDGYGRAWLDADNGPKRLAVITDIEDAAVWARKAFARDGRAPKVGIFGGSYGGYSALTGMTLFAGSYDAGVSIVGIANLVTFLENTAPYRRILRATEYGDPVKDREALVKLSPVTYVDRVKGPLLVIQGANDPRVPAGEAVQIHDALAARGLPVELVIYPDEGHGAGKRENQVHMLARSLLFFREHLAPDAPAAAGPR